MNELEQSLVVRMNCAHEIARQVQDKFLQQGYSLTETIIKTAGWDVFITVVLWRDGRMAHVKRKIEMCLTMSECCQMVDEIHSQILVVPTTSGSILR